MFCLIADDVLFKCAAFFSFAPLCQTGTMRQARAWVNGDGEKCALYFFFSQIQQQQDD